MSQKNAMYSKNDILNITFTEELMMSFLRCYKKWKLGWDRVAITILITKISVSPKKNIYIYTLFFRRIFLVASNFMFECQGYLRLLKPQVNLAFSCSFLSWRGAMCAVYIMYNLNREEMKLNWLLLS